MRRLSALGLALLAAVLASLLWFAVSPRNVAAPGSTQDLPPILNNADLPFKPTEKPLPEDLPATDQSAPTVPKPDGWCFSFRLEVVDSLGLPALIAFVTGVDLMLGDELIASSRNEHGGLVVSDGWVTHTELPLDVAYRTKTWRIQFWATLEWAGGRWEEYREVEEMKPAITDEWILDFSASLDTRECLGDALLFRGRLKHTSGVPLGELGLLLDPPLLLAGGSIGGKTGLRGDFAFLVALSFSGPRIGGDEDLRKDYLDGNDEAATASMSGMIWRACARGDPNYGSVEELELQRIDSPKYKARVFDFGDLMLGGTLLDVQFAAPPADAESTFSLVSGGAEFGWDRISDPVASRRLLVPAGLYVWRAEASWWMIDGQSRAVDGELNLKDGDVRALMIEPPPPRYVELRVCGPDGEFDAALITAEAGDYGLFRHGSQVSVALPCRLLRCWKGELRINVVVRDYRPVEAVIPADAVSLTVEVTERGWERLAFVAVMHLPAGVHVEPEFYCVHESGIAEWGDTSAHSSLGQPVIVSRTGRWHVSAYGGKNYGYPGGMLSGPVVVDVPAQGLPRAEFPVPDAPWPNARTVRFRPTCDGQPVNVNVNCMLHNGVLAPHYMAAYTSVLGKTLVAGKSQIPLTLAISPDDPELAHLTCELPQRLRVTLSGSLPTEQGNHVFVEVRGQHDWRVGVAVHGEAAGKVISLWAPAGPAELVVYLSEYYHSQGRLRLASVRVEVPADGTLDVPIESVAYPVTLHCEDADGTRNVSRSLTWWISGNAADGIECLIRGQTTIAMAAGDYTAVLDDDGRFAIVKFSVQSEGVSVSLPVPSRYQLGDLLVRTPPDLPVDMETEFWVAPAAGNVETFKLDERYPGHLPWRHVPGLRVEGGVLLRGVPLGIPLSLVAYGNTYFSFQATFTAGHNGTLSPTWRTWRKLSSDWEGAGELEWSINESHINFSSKGRLPTGRPRLRRTAQEVEVPAGDLPLPLPPGLAQQLGIEPR